MIEFLDSLPQLPAEYAWVIPVGVGFVALCVIVYLIGTGDDFC